MGWQGEVQTDEEGKTEEWQSNNLVFSTKSEATEYIKGLATRWHAVKRWRVIQVDDRVNSRMADGWALPVTWSRFKGEKS